jgi:multidrug resistance efflux pump
MELLITIAYIFLIRLVFFDYKLMKFNIFWKFIVFGLYAAVLLTEIILLGQFAPYSKSLFVQSYVVQMAPEYGGLVREVNVEANVPVKKGDPLYSMDPANWQYRVDEQEAKLAAADADVAELAQQVEQARARVARTEANLQIRRVELGQIRAAEQKQAVSKLRLEQAQRQVASLEAELEGNRAALRSAQIALDSEVGGRPTAVAEAVAELAKARYNLKHTVIRAPSDGYVSNLQLYPGAFVRLKAPQMTFISSEEHWLLATVRQRGIHRIRPGDPADVAFEMYPGEVFPAVVESIAWATGDSQGMPSGQLPHPGQIKGSDVFMVRLRLKEENPDFPMRFGASGLAAIYSEQSPDFLRALRKIEITSESYLNYLYNPFR